MQWPGRARRPYAGLGCLRASWKSAEKHSKHTITAEAKQRSHIRLTIENALEHARCNMFMYIRITTTIHIVRGAAEFMKSTFVFPSPVTEAVRRPRSTVKRPYPAPMVAGQAVGNVASRWWPACQSGRAISVWDGLVFFLLPVHSVCRSQEASKEMHGVSMKAHSQI